MKKFFLITSLLLVQSIICNAQTNVYHPFPDSNAVWGMSAGCVDSNCGDWSYIQYYYGGDTTIEGISYNKILMEVLPMTNGNCCPVPIGLNSGFLRQDTVAKKVYWRSPWMESDTLLYDFTLNVGDTLNGFLQEPWAQPLLTVVSIDSILVGETYRRRINIDTNTIEPQLNYSIIEGIGSTDGFVAPHINYMGTGINLSCFSVNGSLIYTSPNSPPDTIPCGELPVGLNDLSQQLNDKILLFPNPSSGIITLYTKETYLPVKVTVYDIFGKNLMETKINSEYYEINISDLPKGVYFLRIKNNKTLITIKKIIKQ